MYDLFKKVLYSTRFSQFNLCFDDRIVFIVKLCCHVPLNSGYITIKLNHV